MQPVIDTPAIFCLGHASSSGDISGKGNPTEHIYFQFKKLSIAPWTPISILCTQCFQNVQLQIITCKIKTKHQLLKKCGCDLYIENQSLVQDLQSWNVSQSVIDELIEKAIFTKRKKTFYEKTASKSIQRHPLIQDQIKDISLK